MYEKGDNENTISITFNIDGLPIFPKSNVSALPILAVINEAPPKDRRHHMMLISVWCSKGKPKIMDAYLRPFVEEAQKLFNDGFYYIYNGEKHHKRCRVLAGICDSIAHPPDGNPYGKGLRTMKDTLCHAENRSKGVKGRRIFMMFPILTQFWVILLIGCMRYS